MKGVRCFPPKSKVGALLTVILMALEGTAISQRFQYSISDLDTLGGATSIAHAINSSGQVVGEADTVAGVRHAFLWTNSGGMLDLNTFHEPSIAFGINNLGQVVGTDGPRSGPGDAFLWTSTGGEQNLGVLPGGTFSVALAINDFSQVVGASATSGPDLFEATFWSPGTGLQAITTVSSGGNGIDNSAEVVGFTEEFGGNRAFLWTSSGGVQNLGVVPGADWSQAQAINNLGQVAGTVRVAGNLHAMFWSSSGGMQDLGTLGGPTGWGWSINNQGQVVGTASSVSGSPATCDANATDAACHAFLWSSGAMTDLNTLVSDPTWVLQAATGINDAGKIVGYGLHNGQTRAFLLASPYTATVQQPINADGSSIFRASRDVVPVKFSLALGGVSTCNLPLATIALFRSSGSNPGPINESVYTMPSDTGSNYRISGCQYIYNLGTGSLGTGSYVVQITIGNSVVGSASFGLH